MNRGELRELGLSLRSWAPADTTGDFQAEVNRLLQRALDRLAGDCPSALVPDEEVVVLPVDYNGNSSNAVRVAHTNDPWVLKFTPDTDTNTEAAPYPLVDETMNGLYWIEFKDSAGRWHQRRCRDFWAEPQGLAGETYRYYVSLEKPYHGDSEDMEFRLYAPAVYLRDNNVRILDGVLQTDSLEYIEVRSDFFQTRAGLADNRGQIVGRPLALCRGEHFSLPAPSYRPTITYDDGNTWDGPEPAGTFRYKFTYVWGKRDSEYRSPGNFYEAQFESSPSPASALATVSAGGDPGVTISLPNIEFMQGFDTSGDLREDHSGWRKRIYRARVSVNGTAGVENIESDEVYYLLHESDGDVVAWTDDGSQTPDYFRRMPEIQGYYAWKPVPHQDGRYELKCRVHHRPKPMLADNDAPPIEPQAIEALIQLFVSYLANYDKDLEAAAFHLRQYESEKGKLLALQGQRATVLPARHYRSRVDARGFRQIPLGSFRTE